MSEQATLEPVTLPVKMTRYRLLAGFHNEGIPGTTDQYRTIKAGEVFESPHDWYVDRWPEKFAYVEGTRGGVTGFNWNPAQESLDEFTKRMQSMQDASRLKRAQTGAQQTHGIDANAALANEIENLSTMTVAQLKSYAAEWDIELQSATKREDILRIIVDSMRSVLSAETPAP